MSAGWLASRMPDPTETAGTQRKPFEKQNGPYILAREAFDTELVMREPNGDTYILEYFECVGFLKGVLHLSEVYRNRIMDYLWNFFRVAFDPAVEHIVILRTVDPEGWEQEIRLSFQDKSSEED